MDATRVRQEMQERLGGNQDAGGGATIRVMVTGEPIMVFSDDDLEMWEAEGEEEKVLADGQTLTSEVTISAEYVGEEMGHIEAQGR